MLGFLKRNSKEFKNLGALKTLYFSLVRSQVEYCNVVWAPLYRTHIDRLERIQKAFTRFAIFKFGFRSFLPYHTWCKLLGIDNLANRRKAACSIFVYDILVGKTNCPKLLELIGVSVPSRPLRFLNFLYVPFHRCNYGTMEPLTNCIINFNLIYELIDFNLSREVVIESVRSYFYFLNNG